MSEFFIKTAELAALTGKSRTEMAQEELVERQRKRDLELAEQRSAHNSPQYRIRTWEKLHGLRLPVDPKHPILEVIANGTRLSLAEVRAEQTNRAQHRSGQLDQTG